mgnify:CR=1 FL=1
MILRFNLDKILGMLDRDLLDPDWIHPDGILHLEKWRTFNHEVFRINEVAMAAGLGSARTYFSFIDRTGATPSLVKTYVPDEHRIPKGKPQSFNFLDLCMSRAQQLLDTGKHITVLWSGGLDSTLLLFALIRQAKHIDQLSVLCTFESILESGGLFDAVIKNLGIRVKVDQTRNNCNLPFSYDHEDHEQIYVTGQCADQLFVSRLFKLPEVDPLEHWHNVYHPHIIDLVEPSIKFSERPIETVEDFRWWMTFNYSFTTTLYDSCVERPPHVCKRIISFYATPEFQRWAIHAPVYRDDEYRLPAKQALSQLVDYPYYIQHKRKGFSATWRANRRWYALDKNFKTHYTDVHVYRSYTPSNT